MADAAGTAVVKMVGVEMLAMLAVAAAVVAVAAAAAAAEAEGGGAGGGGGGVGGASWQELRMRHQSRHTRISEDMNSTMIFRKGYICCLDEREQVLLKICKF